MGERLTKRVVDAAKPGEKDAFIWDADIKGFGLKITASRKTAEKGGKKVYIFQDRVKGDTTKTRVTIGEHGTFTTDEARTEADNLRSMFKRGIRPADLKKAAEDNAERERREAEESQRRAFSAVAERYFVARVRKQANAKPVEALIRNVFVTLWQDRDIATIARKDVVAVLDEMVADERPGAAREALKRIRPLFGFAVEKEDIPTNPAENIRLDDKYVPRDRVLSDLELAEVWRAADVVGYPFGPLVKLLVLTGARLREVAEARWAEFDLAADIWTIPAERSKNRKPHILHLSPQATAILEALPRTDGSPFILTTTGRAPVSGFSKAKGHLDKAIAAARATAAEGREVEAMPEWTYHDLRRSFATGGARLGIAMHIVERVLNHVPAAVKGVAKVYQHHEFLPERKAALEAWGRHVDMVVNTTTAAANVVPLHRAG
jgi:integrase